MKQNMNKNYITALFAERLRSSLINAGYKSSRTQSGVNILKFASTINYSPQICRKYLRGEAIPEPQKIYEIAELLNVSPGWLMFGDCHAQQEHQSNKITISKNLLHHLFIHISELCSPIPSPQYLPQLWLELAEDIQELNTNEEQSKKIIDIALASLKHFRNKNKNDD
jgi:transcriptional regulator with XRE-family HTH domain